MRAKLFGVYQPLLGWRSKKIQKRLERAFSIDISNIQRSLYKQFRGRFEFTLNNDRSLQDVRVLQPASAERATPRATGSFVLDAVAADLPRYRNTTTLCGTNVIQTDSLANVLTEVVVPRTRDWYTTAADRGRAGSAATRAGIAALKQEDILNKMLGEQLNRESALAGYLLYLKHNNNFAALKDIFYQKQEAQIATQLARLSQLLTFRDPLDIMDPRHDIDRVSLSPLGIVHLFRQYFFEFDTFLGPPVSHVWLSPGGTVELIEINSRKTIVEKTVETALETTIKTEKSLTEEDEIADAVKQNNQSDTKFGMNATANQSWIGGSASASASINMNTTQEKAREVTHRHMRQQTEKLSTEIRRNFKSTFKTITEVTDTSSKRYLLNNNSEKLINYELRRKMRQVGVQVQDIGTYLCWQTYVDDPGRQLGVAKLVHIAKDPDLSSIPSPEAEPMPQKIETQTAIDIPFIPLTGSDAELDDEDVYKDGVEVNTDWAEAPKNAETIRVELWTDRGRV